MSFDPKDNTPNWNKPSRPLPPPHMGPCHEIGKDIYRPGVPNPVDACVPPPPHVHPPIPRPDEEKYVTKRQLNEILKNIGEADIFTDLSPDGTTVSVGGIKKGTKFTKIVFSEFIKKLLYPETSPEPDPTDYITREQLEMILSETLSKVATSGQYEDLKGLPTDFDYVYPSKDASGKTLLNSTVAYPIGEFKAGDSLEGMKMSQIIEKALCGVNKWGYFVWKSDLKELTSGTLELDADELCPELVKECESAESVESFFTNEMTDGRYELYVECVSADVDNPDAYVYDCLIALSNTASGEHPQITNPTLSDVPSDITWTYDSDRKKIVFSGGGITTDVMLVMIRRF